MKLAEVDAKKDELGKQFKEFTINKDDEINSYAESMAIGLQVLTYNQVYTNLMRKKTPKGISDQEVINVDLIELEQVSYLVKYKIGLDLSVLKMAIELGFKQRGVDRHEVRYENAVKLYELYKNRDPDRARKYELKIEELKEFIKFNFDESIITGLESKLNGLDLMDDAYPVAVAELLRAYGNALCEAVRTGKKDLSSKYFDKLKSLTLVLA